MEREHTLKSFEDSLKEDLQLLGIELANYQNKTPKKVLIVIGKMGHGKSSFIKMLVSDEDKKKIKCGSGIKSVTNSCELYEICEDAKIRLSIPKGQKIYVMDTPGLNSGSNFLYLINDQIKNYILKQKCDIIGVAFIRSASDFRQQNSFNSIIMHQILPITKFVKEEISFYVFTNFDRYIGEQDQINQNVKELVKEFQKADINFIEKRNLYWMSFPNTKPENLMKKIQKLTEYSDAYMWQWQRLSDMLKDRKCKYFSHQQFTQAIKIFDRFFIQKIEKQLLYQQTQTTLQTTSFKFKTKLDQQGQIYLETGVLIGQGSIVAGFGCGLVVQTAAATAAVVGLAATGFLVGIIAAKFGYYLLKKACATQNESLKQTLKNVLKTEQQIQQSRLQQMAIKYTKNIIFQSLEIQIKPNNFIQFKYKEFIEKITVKIKELDEDGQQKNQQKTQQILQRKYRIRENQTIYYTNLKLKNHMDYEFIIRFRRPTEKVILEIIKEVSREVYASPALNVKEEIRQQMNEFEEIKCEDIKCEQILELQKFSIQ